MDQRVAPVRHIVEDPPGAAREFNCPVEVAIAPISGKWKPVILWHLSAPDAAVRFSDLRRLILADGALMVVEAPAAVGVSDE